MIYIFQRLNKLLLLAVVLLAPLPALAQEAISYTISPAIFDMTANPGQTFSSTLRIINTNPYELHVYVERNNFLPKDEEGVPEFISPDETDAVKSTFAEWINTEREFIIAPEQTVELPFQIILPPDAAPGGHFAALMVSTKPPEDPGKQSKVKTAQTISALLFMRVTGDISENSSVRSFRTSSYFLSKPEATFELRIENKGNVHVQPQGEIKIFNMWGKERGKIPVNQFTLFGNVLPNSVRKFAFTWSSEWSITDIGRYTAVATLAYGVDTRQTMYADTAFWIIPWKFLLTIILVVGGFIALMTWAIKAYVKRVLLLAGVRPGAVPVTAPTEPDPIPVTGKRTKSAALKKGSTVKEKTKRAAAPLEAGILDLRGRLQNKRTLKERVVVLGTFVRQYWKFFAVALAAIIFLVLVILFFKGAFQPTRDFDVTIKSQGQNIKLENAPTLDAPGTAPVSEAASSTATTSVSLVNRSGNDALLDEVRQTLAESEISIASTSTDVASVEEKTVIVYPPSAAPQALRLSQLLGNALLSAYSDGSAGQGIVIYIGEDQKTRE